MHRRAFLSLLFAGAGCAVVVSSAKAQTIATVLADTPTDVPATDFSSKGGHGGGRVTGTGVAFRLVGAEVERSVGVVDPVRRALRRKAGANLWSPERVGSDYKNFRPPLAAFLFRTGSE